MAQQVMLRTDGVAKVITSTTLTLTASAQTVTLSGPSCNFVFSLPSGVTTGASISFSGSAATASNFTVSAASVVHIYGCVETSSISVIGGAGGGVLSILAY